MTTKSGKFYLTNLVGQPVTKTPAGVDITGHGFDTKEELIVFRDQHFPDNEEIIEVPLHDTSK